MPETRRSSTRSSMATSSTATVQKKKTNRVQKSANTEKVAASTAKKSASSSSVKAPRANSTRLSEPVVKDILINDVEYEGTPVSEMKYDALRAALKAMGLPRKGTKIEMALVLSDVLKSSTSLSSSSKKEKEIVTEEEKKVTKSSEGSRKQRRKATAVEDTIAPKTTTRRATRGLNAEPPTPSEISVYSKNASKSSKSKKVEVLDEEDEREEEADIEDSDDVSLAKYSTDSDDEGDVAEEAVSMEEIQNVRKLSPVKVPESWPSFGAGFNNVSKPPVVPLPTATKTKVELPKFDLPKPPPSTQLSTHTLDGLATKKQGFFSSLKQQTSAPASTATSSAAQVPSSTVDLTLQEEAPLGNDTNSEELLQSLNRRFMEAVQGGPKLSEVEHKLMLNLINGSRKDSEPKEPAIVPKRFFEIGPSMQKTLSNRLSFGGTVPSKFTDLEPVVEKRLASSFLAGDSSDNTFQSSKRSRVVENSWGTTVTAPVLTAPGMTDSRETMGVFPRQSTFPHTPSKVNAGRHVSASLLALQPTPGRQDLKRNLLVTSLQRRKTFGGRQQTPMKLTVGTSNNEGSKTVAKRILQSLGDMASPLEVHRRKPVAAQWGMTGPSGMANIVGSTPTRLNVLKTNECDSNDKPENATTSGATDSQSWRLSNQKSNFHGADKVGKSGLNGYVNSHDENRSFIEKNGIAIGEGEDFSFAAPLLLQEDLGEFNDANNFLMNMEFSFSAPSVAEKRQEVVNKSWERKTFEKDKGLHQGNGDNGEVEIANTEAEKPKKSIWEIASNKWKCEVCLGQNEPKDEKCILCDAPKGAPAVMGGAPEAATEASKAASKPFTGFAPPTVAPATGSIGAGGFTFGAVKSSATPAASNDDNVKGPSVITSDNPSSKPSPFVFSAATSKPTHNGVTVTNDNKISVETSKTVEQKSGFIFGAQSAAVEISNNHAHKIDESPGTSSEATTAFGSSSGSSGAPSLSFGAPSATTAPDDKTKTSVAFSFNASESNSSNPSSTEADKEESMKKKRAMGDDDHESKTKEKLTAELPKFPGFAPTSSEFSGSLGTSKTANPAPTNLPSSNPFSSASSLLLPSSAIDTKPSSVAPPVFGSIKSSSTTAVSPAPFSFPSIPSGSIKGEAPKADSESSELKTKAPVMTGEKPAFTFGATSETSNSSATISNPFAASSSTTPSTISNPFSSKADTVNGGAQATVGNIFSSSATADSEKDSTKKTADIFNPFATSSDTSLTNSDNKVITSSAPASPPRANRADSQHSQAADSPMSMMDTGYSSETNSNHGSSSSKSLPPPAFNFGSGGPFSFGASSGIASTASSTSVGPTTTTPSAATVNPFGGASSTAVANPFSSTASNPFASSGPASFPAIPASNPFGSSDKSQLTSTQPTGNPFGTTASNPFGGGAGATAANQFSGPSSTNFAAAPNFGSAAPNPFGAAPSAPPNPFGGGVGGAEPIGGAGGFSMGATSQTGRRKVRVKRG